MGLTECSCVYNVVSILMPWWGLTLLLLHFFVEVTRASDWDSIVACHRGLSQVTTWNFQKSTMGKLRLCHPRFEEKEFQTATAKASILCFVSNKLCTRVVCFWKLFYTSHKVWTFVIELCDNSHRVFLCLTGMWQYLGTHIKLIWNYSLIEK